MSRTPAAVLSLLLLLATGGCDEPTEAPNPTPTRAEAETPGAQSPEARVSPVPEERQSSTKPSTSTGWTVTVYYTAVERFHDGRDTKVTGCPKLDCVRGNADLGTYPADFVKAVRDEGTGRTSAGRYLNWSYDTGFWLDDAPRDTAGRPLRPWQSAAADPEVLRQGTRFTIVDCGRDDDGGRIDATVCGRMRAARWQITDEFTPGLGGSRHLDVYIGEATQRNFTQTAWYTTLNRATLAF